jgi:transketolase
VSQGAYVLAQGEDVVLLASGSEVHVALAARNKLAGSGISARVVSMPSWELFESQPLEYQEEVLPHTQPTLAIEAGRSLGWCRFAETVTSVDRFGASAPADTLFEAFGLTSDHVAARARALLSR